jgi:peptide/nickel transport system substrate-binding protein
MRMTIGSRRLTALVGMVVVVSWACSTSPSATTPTNKTLIVEKTIQLDSLDPSRGAQQIATIVDKAAYDTLTTVNPRDLSKPYPWLATSWSSNTDDTVWTFKLRHGVNFAGGNPLTSADVVFSLTRLANSVAPTGVSGFMAGLTATAPDPYTVVFTSTSPNAAVPVIMTESNEGIVDSKVVMQHGGTDTASDNAQPFMDSASAGSGPYMVTSVDPTSQIILKANPNFWGTKPAYSTIIIRNVPPATQRLDIQDGQAQVAADIPTSDAASLSTSQLNVYSYPSPDATLLYMNESPSVSAMTANQHFRDAVRLGLDYSGLVTLAGKGAAQGTGFIPNGFAGALPASEAPKRDLNAAKAALAQVGVANPSVDLIWMPDYTADGLSQQTIATKVQSDLKEVGINVTLVSEEQLVENAKMQAGLIPMVLITFPADYPDPSDYLPEGEPTGYVMTWFNWKTGVNPNIDTLATAAEHAITPADRNSAYQALDRADNAQEGVIPLMQPGRAIVTVKSVHYVPNPFLIVDLQAFS